MFLLPRRQIWTQQPQALTGIDRSGSITRDLCFVQSGGLADIFTNVGTTQKPTTRGVVRSFDAALSQYLFANNKQVVGPALTLFALFSVNNLTGNLALISVGGPASSRHILYVAPGGIAALFSSDGVPYGQAQSATGVLSDTAQYYFSVGRVSANNSRDIWVNGIQVASDSTSVAVSPANIDRVAIGAYWNNGAPVAETYFDGNIALSGAYSRALSDDEIVVLSANPWQIFKRPDSSIFIPVSAGGGTTTVTSDSTASYKLQGSVQASASAAYDIRTAIQADSAASYAIRSSVQQSIALSYSIMAAIQQDTVPSYSIRGLADQAITASYAIRSAISSDASATYNILSATSVSSSTSADYNIRGSINQDCAASYALRGSITQDCAASYALRGSITQDCAASYALRGSIIRDTSATYSILSASSVSASVTAGYVVKGSIQSSIVAGYSIAQAVQAEIAASYIIRSGVVSEAQAAYIVRGLVQQSVAASYSVFSEYAAPSTFADRTDLKSMMTQHAELKSMMTQHLLLQASIG